MCITLCSGVQMLVDGLFTSVGMFTRLYIDKPLILASWRLRRLWQTRPTRRTRPSRPTRPRSSPCQCRSQKGWFQTGPVCRCDHGKWEWIASEMRKCGSKKDTWSCRCCHHFGSVITYLKQFMRPEISHQVGEAHEILVTGEAKASQFLFSYTVM